LSDLNEFEVIFLFHFINILQNWSCILIDQSLNIAIDADYLKVVWEQGEEITFGNFVFPDNIYQIIIYLGFQLLKKK
jgi:hypothetical protein